MSDIARRTLRITVIAAAMAALGAGLVGNAFAAPSTDTARTSPSGTSTGRGDTQTYSARTSSNQDPDGPLAQMDSTRLVNDLVGPVVGPQAVGGSTLGLPLG
jgi:hypothetical protein